MFNTSVLYLVICFCSTQSLSERYVLPDEHGSAVQIFAFVLMMKIRVTKEMMNPTQMRMWMKINRATGYLLVHTLQ